MLLEQQLKKKNPKPATKMTYSEFKSHLEKKQLSSSYLFVGPEDFLIDDCLKRIVDQVVDPGTKDFNFDVFYGNEIDGGKILDTVNAYPMLSDSRLVVVKDFQKLPASGLDLLAKYLEKPVSSTKLVLTSPKIDLRNKAFSKIKSRSIYIEFKPLYDNEVPTWIQSYLKGKNLQISHEAGILIQARVGNNLRALVNELDKIILNLEGENKIEEADVQKVVGVSRNFSVFNLNDAIGNRDLNKSLTILNLIIESGESPTGIVAMITRHFVNLLKVKGAMTLKKSQNEITGLTGIPPFFIRKSKEMASNYSSLQFHDIFESLLQADLILKTSQQSPQIALQTLLIKIINDVGADINFKSLIS